MLPGEHERMRAVEDSHWWYQVLRGLVLDSLKQTTPLGERVLDVGCGTGGMLALIKDHVTYGIDSAANAVRICQRRGLTNVEMAKVEQLPFPNHHFRAVLCLDVLYHVTVNEKAALAEIRRVLKPGGQLIVNLPAFQCLRGSHDIAVSGVRRYRKKGLADLLHEQGFHVNRLHYWNAWSFGPLWAWRRWSLGRTKTHASSDLRELPSWLNASLVILGQIDARLCRSLHLPFGSSVFAVACSG